jgi:hypothetical protein
MPENKALPASQLNPSPEQILALWPWISGQTTLRLARAHLLTQDSDLALAAARNLQHFITHNPPLMGFGWIEPKWIAVRALNWLFAFCFLKDISSWDPKLLTQIMVQLRVMGSVLAQEPDDPAQPGKCRQVGAAAALLFLGSTLTFLPESSRWLQKGQARLGANLMAWSDVNTPLPTAEVAAAVQWGGLGLWLGSKSDLELPGVVAGLRKLVPLCRALAPPWGSDPAWGWTPLKTVLGFDAKRDPYTTGANLAALISNDPDLRAGRVLSETHYWLFGAETLESLRQLAGGVPPQADDFPGAGLSLLCTTVKKNKLNICLRTCPRIPVSDKAWDAQALSLSLSLNGKPLLITPGPPGSGPLAPHLASRPAHNTLVIDRSEPRQGKVELESLESYDQHVFVAASYDGYGHLDDPVSLRRRVFLDRESGMVNLVDQIQSQGEHLCEVFFHLALETEVKSGPNGMLTLKGPFGEAGFRPETKAKVEVVSGRSKPPLGWLADDQGKISIAPVLVVRAKVMGSTRLTNVIVLPSG